MSKKKNQVRPNYSPVYAAALYPDLAKIFVRHGYALAVHGSLARDFDLIAVPWGVKVTPPPDVVKEITKKFWIKLVGTNPEMRRYGRIAYMISVGHGSCSIDLSFIPLRSQTKHLTSIGK